MAGSPRGERRTWHGVVARTQWLTPVLVRVVLTGDELRELPALGYTDHYIKIHFPAPAEQSEAGGWVAAPPLPGRAGGGD